MNTKNRSTCIFRNFEFSDVFREFDIFVSSDGIYASRFPYGRAGNAIFAKSASEICIVRYLSLALRC